MKYELTKELKDAGFPFAFYDSTCEVGGRVEGHFCNTPTLAELIEACGDAFGELIRIGNGQWQATLFSFNSVKEGITQASAEEAVARLWLALNKKS